MSLTIVYSRGEPHEVRLILSGRFAGAAVEDFAQQLTEAAIASTRVVVDVQRVTSIDRTGARCLADLDPDRAELVGVPAGVGRAIRREQNP